MTRLEFLQSDGQVTLDKEFANALGRTIRDDELRECDGITLEGGRLREVKSRLKKRMEVLKKVRARRKKEGIKAGRPPIPVQGEIKVHSTEYYRLKKREQRERDKKLKLERKFV